jgi:DNA-binding response OmpR family regulator
MEPMNDQFPVLKRGRSRLADDQKVAKMRRELWRAVQKGTLSEEEFASTAARLDFSNAVLEPALTSHSALERQSGKHTGVRWPGVGQARVLLVLERPVLAELITLTLNHGVCTTRAATVASEVETTVAKWQPHLVILDTDLYAAQISSLVGTLTPSGGRPPIIGLTRRGDLKTKLVAFESGVDDILTVPFAPEELLARVIAVVRRFYSVPVTFTPVLKIGELEIDILKRTVQVGASELHLTSLEQSLLYLLAANAGRVVSRDEILDALWGIDYVAESNIVDRQIRNLRARLRDDWHEPRFIATVPGRGYRFLASIDVEATLALGQRLHASAVGHG